MKRLNSKEKKLIVHAIGDAEHQTSGEIRVHLSYSGAEKELLPIAQKQFEKLKMNLTKERNGILLYINPKVRKFAVFGDIGIHEKVGQIFWEELKDQIQKNIQEKDLTSGIVHAVTKLGMQLKTYFPCIDQNKNELQNDISES